MFIVVVAPATMPACPRVYSDAAHAVLGYTVLAIPDIVSAAITSSIICTSASTSDASVAVAAVPKIFWLTTTCNAVTVASVTTALAIVAKR